MSISNADLQFKSAIQAAGITPPEHIRADGKIHRFSANGKRGDAAGWYVFHGNNIPAGSFGNWRTDTSCNWRADIGRKLTPEEEANCRKRIATIQREREAAEAKRREEVKIKANALWSKATPATNHPYLTKKHIHPHGTRIYRGLLVVPIYSESKRIVNLQFITPESEKRFLSGGRKRGCFHVMGDLSGRILICEGFATGASLYEDSGQGVVVAFDAGNLLPVARNVRELLPDDEIIICGDNDLSNIGQNKAREAALAVGGKLMIPPVEGMDWNDYLAGGEK